MSHIPFGYRIVNGKAVADDVAAEQIKALFQAYVSGDSLSEAAKRAGIKASHSVGGRILKNVRYLGDAFYPAIIDAETFKAAESERIRRAEKRIRNKKPEVKKEAAFPTSFRFNESTQEYSDPFEQAEYAYSLIETEMCKDDKQYECYSHSTEKECKQM